MAGMRWWALLIALSAGPWIGAAETPNIVVTLADDLGLGQRDERNSSSQLPASDRVQ